MSTALSQISEIEEVSKLLGTFESLLKELKSGKLSDSQAKLLKKPLKSAVAELNRTALNLKATVKALDDDKALADILDDIKEDNSVLDMEEPHHTNKLHYYAGPNHYLYLSQRGKVQAEYIWIGGSGLDLRCKTKTLAGVPKSLKELPDWNYDGSSTGQAQGHDSEVWIRPVKMVADPFRRGSNILVLCETLNPVTMKPIETNRRSDALEIFNNPKVIKESPWFGIEQEYTMFESDGITPLGWPKGGFPGPQGPYYCSVGAKKAYGRDIVEAHYRACLYAGISISGINAEVMPGQWEFQVGPCEGIDSGDQLWLARYILERVAEEFNTVVSFDTKPVKGDWNGAGCHTNYSTKTMRSKNGYDEIIKACEKLKKRHVYHMTKYGKGNHKRLTGKHETQHFSKFSYGVANRGASIRIPRQTEIDKCGYMEDRRPGANMDPYDVTSLIAHTTILWDETPDKDNL